MRRSSPSGRPRSGSADWAERARRVLGAFRELRRDEGSASLEFITAGMLLLIPTLYLIVAIATVQAAALATEGAARHAARVFVQAPTTDAGAAAATRTLELALADHGVEPVDATVTITCAPVADQCHTRRGWVTVSIQTRVALPLVPAALDVATPLSVPIEAHATQQVSRFWGAR